MWCLPLKLSCISQVTGAVETLTGTVHQIILNYLVMIALNMSRRGDSYVLVVLRRPSS